MSPLCLTQSDSRLPGALSELLEVGGVVIFPTDTVYGLGGNPWDERAVERIRRMKGRPADQPFTLHLTTRDGVGSFATLDEQARRAIDLLLPGPITLLLSARPQAPRAVTHKGKVGIRVPKHRFFSEVLHCLGASLFGTSVNRSGEPPLHSVETMIESFPEIDLIVEGEAGSGVPSAIIDLTTDPPRALRGRVPDTLFTGRGPSPRQGRG